MTSLAVQVRILTSPPAVVTLNLLLILIGKYLLLCLRLPTLNLTNFHLSMWEHQTLFPLCSRKANCLVWRGPLSMATQNLKLKCKALSLILMLKISMRTSVTLCHQTLMGFGLKTLFWATYCLLASIPQAQSLTTAPVLSRGVTPGLAVEGSPSQPGWFERPCLYILAGGCSPEDTLKANFNVAQ